MKKYLVILGVVLWGLAHLYGNQRQSIHRQEEIAKEVIRLHVVANSDTPEDQKLKLEVKEEVVNLLREKMKQNTSVQEAEKTLQSQIPEIEATAVNYMREKGYPYSVKAELGDCYFPVKEYGDMTFPAGEYRALKVNIGESQGKNWWCIMYPTLCLVDSTYQVVPEESKEKLKANLTAEEYESLLTGGDDVEYGFKVVEMVKDFLK